MWQRIGLSVIFSISLLLALGIAPAAAESTSEAANLSIRPVGTTDSYFTVTAQPGDVIDLEVELANHGTAPVMVQTYSADTYSLINGGFGVKLADELTSGTTKWIDYPAETFELAPETSTIRAVKIEIPADAEAGQFLSSLVIQNAVPTAATGEGVGFQQVNRQAIAVAIELPGPAAPGLELGAVSHKHSGGKSVLLVDVENTGNRHMKLEGAVIVSGPDNIEVLSRAVSMQTVYARTTTQLEVPVGAALEAGEYAISLELGNAQLGISEKLELAPVTIPALPMPAAAAEPQQDPATSAGEAAIRAGEPETAAAPVAGSGIETWMLISGIAGALALGAGGAVLVVILMRRRERRSATGAVPPVPSTGHAPVSGGSDRAPEPAAPEHLPPSHAPRPQIRPVVRERPSARVQNLLQASSAVRNNMASLERLESHD